MVDSLEAERLTLPAVVAAEWWDQAGQAGRAPEGVAWVRQQRKQVEAPLVLQHQWKPVQMLEADFPQLPSLSPAGAPRLFRAVTAGRRRLFGPKEVGMHLRWRWHERPQQPGVPFSFDLVLHPNWRWGAGGKMGESDSLAECYGSPRLN